MLKFSRLFIQQKKTKTTTFRFSKLYSLLLKEPVYYYALLQCAIQLQRKKSCCGGNPGQQKILTSKSAPPCK